MRRNLTAVLSRSTERLTLSPLPHKQGNDMSKYTKGPLQVLIADSERMKGANCVLISGNGDQIARCSAPFPFDTSWDERDANAHRLALAWNTHDELLASLEAVAHLLSACALIINHAESRAHAIATANAAKSLVAKATGA
jgi:hypothetical protein